jgi:hypothetical protein
MRDIQVVVTGVIVSGLLVNASPALAETFQRIVGAQIQARFAGMELSDDVHWREHFDRGGTVKSVSMGRKRIGKWKIEKNELCIDYGKEDSGCYEVWLAGKKVELRRPGLDTPSLEGSLQKPILRN